MAQATQKSVVAEVDASRDVGSATNSAGPLSIVSSASSQSRKLLKKFMNIRKMCFRNQKRNKENLGEDFLLDVLEIAKLFEGASFLDCNGTLTESRALFYATPSNAPPCDYCLLFSDKKYVLKNLVPISKALYSYTLDGKIAKNCFFLCILQVKKRLSLRITLRKECEAQFYHAMANLCNAASAGFTNFPFSEDALKLTDAQKKYLLYLSLVDILGSFDNCLHDNLFPVHVPTLRNQIWKYHTRSTISFFLGPVNEDYIYSYFGSEIAFYFSWMNHSSRWLLWASLVGLAMRALKSLLSPSSLFSEFLNPVYTLVVVINGVICVKMWERKVEVLFVRFRLFHNLQRDEKNWRYRGKVALDAVTGKEKLSYSSRKRFFILQPISWIIILAYIALTFVITVCSANLDRIVHERSWLAIPRLQAIALPGKLYGPDSLFWWLPIVFYFCIITVLSTIFFSLARKLTEMENYEYRGDFIRALTQKRFALESVNRYSKLFLVLFVTRSKELLIQNIKAIFIIEEVLRILVETSFSLFSSCWGIFSGRGQGDTFYLNDLDETLPFYEVYQDFIQMAIQLGYIVLFTSVYPIAPTVAALTQLVELKTDLFALCYTQRRPVPRYGSRQIGTWCDIFRLLVITSLMTNSFFFVFCESSKAVSALLSVLSLFISDDFDVRMKSSLVLLFITIEHVLILLSLFIYWRIPSKPKKVKDYIAKKRVEHGENKPMYKNTSLE